MTEPSQDLVEQDDGKKQLEVEFNLDQVEMQFGEFVTRRKRHDGDGKWLKEFKVLFGKLVGNARVFKLHNRKVAHYVLGQLNLSELQKEQPDIVKKYTRIIAEEKFDEEAFKNDEPELHEQYRARRLVLISGAPDIDGLS